MKRSTYVILVVLVMGVVVFGVGPRRPVDPFGMAIDKIKSQIEAIPKKPLDKEEIEGLLRMREEEKLAHDVYTVLYEKWKLRVFENIIKSEKVHMEAVKFLLDRYLLDDPVKDYTVGKFTSKEMKELYEKLVKMGLESAENALKVGMIIEDLDIYDLKVLIKKTDNEDIKIVYENLMKGSRNHMRAFYKNLQTMGLSYEPQYISKEEFEKIISTPTER